MFQTSGASIVGGLVLGGALGAIAVLLVARAGRGAR